MTNFVRAPDPPLVDPETGETAPLSPMAQTYLDRLRSDPERYRQFIHGVWSMDKPREPLPDELEPSGREVVVSFSPAPRIAEAVELLKVDPERYRKYVEGSWDVAEPDDAA